MGFTFLLVSTTLVAALLGVSEWRGLRRETRRDRRRAFIASYRFPPSVRHRLRQEHPALDDAAIDRCLEGLRCFFKLHHPRVRPLGMPSRGVDLAWHAFLLDTPAYAAFCSQAFDTFLHHMPDAPDATLAATRESLRRCWVANCRDENIDPESPRRLPSLFALDMAIGLSGGFQVTAEELVWLTGKPPPKPGSRDPQTGGGCGSFGACGSSASGDGDGDGDGGGGGCGSGCGCGGGGG